jgi:hypothetical protein
MFYAIHGAQVMLGQVEALVDLCIKGLADPHPKVGRNLHQLDED